jgi:hypothetical protein
VTTALPAIGSPLDLAMSQADSWYWAWSRQIQLVPGPFQLADHQFQVRPMSIRPAIKVVRKATQMLFTESEVLDVLHGMIHGLYPVGVYYLFPNKEKVSEFSKTRFKTLISSNPEEIGQYVQDTDSVSLKRIGNAFLYFKSGRLAQEIAGQMKSSAALKGDPCDHAVFDELDEMVPYQQVESYVDGRMSFSKIQTKHFLANPTFPSYGISAKFDESDQEYWFSRCTKCRAWTCLDDEDLSPEEIFIERIRDLSDGTVIRACSKCGAEIDPRNGQWVAKRPDITDIIGFTIGHPSAPWIKPADLLKEWRQTADRGNLIRLGLGRPYVEAENRLTVQEVLACCGLSGIQDSDRGPCFMGVDQGGGEKDLFHVTIGKHHPVRAANYLHIGIYKGWDELDGLMKRFKVLRCVIDGLPNQEAARAFAKRFPGRVFLSYFSKHQKGEYKWDEEQYTVTSNRTEALDASHRELQGGAVILPRRDLDVIQLFAQHCNAIAKKLEEDEETGAKTYVYIRLKRADHFRFSQCYECMARQGAPNLLYPEML